MPESGKLINYRLNDEAHSYRSFGEFAHEHDGEAHEHEGGDQFHYHYPGIPPGWEPAYLEG